MPFGGLDLKQEKLTRFIRTEDADKKWYVVDATDKVLGRLATQVATVIRGKHKAIFTPNMDTGDFVIVINADKIKMTGKRVLTGRHFMKGDYAISEGALAAGLNFFGGYPITPATPVAERVSSRCLDIPDCDFLQISEPVKSSLFDRAHPQDYFFAEVYDPIV